MSRLGKKIIKIPDGVEIKVDGQRIKVKGPKGELEKDIPDILGVEIVDGGARVKLHDGLSETRDHSMFWG
ncbi:MAG: 50S ribosomal protein L6, partial [Patescibacteria group bacterium]